MAFYCLLLFSGAVLCLLLGVSVIHFRTDTVFLLYPVFAVNLLLLLVTVVIFLWRRYVASSSLSHKVVFSLRQVVISVIKLHTDVVESPGDNEQSIDRKKALREIIFFLLAQHCLATPYHFVWLHSLLAYKSAAGLVKDYIASMQEVNNSMVVHDGNTTENATENGMDSNVTDTRSDEEIIQDHTQLAAYMMKAFIILLVAHYQISRLKLAYTLVTMTYFLAVEGVLESYLTHCLEIEQFDIIEGLEQYYVRLFHGIAEMLLTLYFMLWLLISNHQILMLIALYTNIYSQGRYLFQNTICAIFAEWSVVAHFEKASEAELLSLDDICAVCLTVMRKARRTPCRHYFHGHCLRRCLKVKSSCPICNFRFDFFLN